MTQSSFPLSAVTSRAELWFDVSEVIIHFGRYGKPTGIQRVTCCLLREMRKLPEVGVRSHLFRIDPLSGKFHEVDWTFLDLIFERSQSDQSPDTVQPFGGGKKGGEAPSLLARRVFELLPYELQPSARQLALALAAFLKAALRITKGKFKTLQRRFAHPTSAENEKSYMERLAPMIKPSADPARGSVLINLGASWGVSHHTQAITDIKQRCGARYVLMLHDVIAQFEPDFFPGYFFGVMRNWLLQNIKLADQIVTISKHTQSEIMRWCKKESITPPPVDVVILGQDITANNGAGAKLPDALNCHQFALFVSTLDPRKNHALLFSVWKRLVAAYGERAPKLVFVGNRGWSMDDFIDRMESSNWLNGHVVWLCGAGDALLQSLYRSCRFTVYPSLAEGWGLPVGEGLAFGKPCLASSATSVPEAGEEFAEYFDPTDLRECYDLVEKYAFDDKHLHERERLISEQFHLRSWKDTANDLSVLLERFNNG